jgi:hypothetical protein
LHDRSAALTVFVLDARGRIVSQIADAAAASESAAPLYVRLIKVVHVELLVLATVVRRHNKAANEETAAAEAGERLQRGDGETRGEGKDAE